MVEREKVADSISISASKVSKTIQTAAPVQWHPLPPTPEPPAPQPRPPLALPTFRPVVQPQPQEPTAPGAPPTTGLSSVPPSPTRRTSVPSSPVTKITQTTTSVPSSPIKTKDSASLPASPSPKPAPSSTLQYSPPSPPKPLSTSPVRQLPTSPVKTVPTSPVKTVPTSPVKTVPTSPVKTVPTSPVKTVPTSPVKTVPTITSTFINGTTTTTRLPTPTPSPRTIKPAVQTPPLSPKQKPTAPPPSPLILPPPQLKSKPELEPKIPVEAEQKGVLVQKTIETPKPRVSGPQKDLHESHRPHIAHLHHGKREEHKDFEAKKKGGHHKKFSSDSEEGGMKVITIAGENKGAFMEVIKSPVKHGFDGSPHSLGRIDPKTEKGGSVWHKHGSSSSSGEEENSKKKDKSHKEKGLHSPPMDAYMNSNVQGVNNSILFNSSCSHHDPGVHLSLSRKPFAKGFHVKDKDSSNGHHS
ncbi:hypothetical protein Patl1_00659 [Pistacia atlantica]|uniref:Uncharacterized protein n=1 Tax=Pistacia atlantica TaxID=434234 RepID=A0ACC1C6Y4_9ROSI|nr:hypothetical protein Patl1_00659 [Pistacia atlantica]